jgi:hypothetical protein
MSEKASRNEGADEAAEIAKDLPGISSGEELALGPVEGEEIDPLPKWWDEPLATEKSKSGNRRLEDGIEFETPRRKKPLPRLDEEELAKPLELPVEKGDFPEMPALTPVARKSGIEGMPELADPVEILPEAPKDVAGTRPLPEMEFETKPLKRHRREDGEGDDGDLSDFFSGLGKEVGVEEPVVEAKTPEIPTDEPDLSLPDFLKDLPSTSQDEVNTVPGLPRKSGPPPLPATTAPATVETAAETLPTPSEPAPSVKNEEGKVDETSAEAPATTTPVDEETQPVVAVAVESAPESKEVALETKSEGPAIEEPEEQPVEIDLPPVAPEAGIPEEAKPPVEPVQVIGGPLPVPTPETEAALPKTDVGDSVPTRKKAGCWTVFATFFFFASMLLLVVLGGAAAFAWTKFGDFEKEITTVATTQLEEQGIHLDYGSWSYEFPRGVVFDEVTFYDDATKARPAIKISGLGVNVDFLSLAKNPGELGGAEFSVSDSKVTLFQKGELFAEIEGVDGEILVDASTIKVERLDAKVGGLRVSLDGVVRLPDKATNVAAAPAGESAPEGTAKASPLASLDFSGFRALQPWLGLEGTGSQPPLLALSFEMDAKEPDLATIEGTLGGSNLKWRGIELKSLAASFRIDPKTGELRFPNVQMGYGDGLVSAVFAIDMSAQKLRIESLQSTVDPIALLTAYDSTWADKFKSVRFADAPTVQIVGEMPLGDLANADLKIRYEHRQGFTYLDGARELPISDIRGLFDYDRGALETNDAAGNLFGGQLYLNGATNLIREKHPFTGLIEITGMDLKKASGWFGEDGAGLDGRLNLTFRGTGNAEIASINGGGNLRIEEASLPGFPAIGPAQELIGKVVPAFAFKGSGTVTGAYILESGVLVTSDLTVRNSGARLVTNGNVNLASKATTFVVTADLEPVLAAATGLKDKSIQIEGSGPLDHPELKIRQFPVEFAASGLGEVLGTSPESLGGLKELIGSGNAAEVISGKIEEATGLQLDPAVTDLLKGLMGGEDAPAAPAPAPAPIRAVPQ